MYQVYILIYADENGYTVLLTGLAARLMDSVIMYNKS